MDAHITLDALGFVHPDCGKNNEPPAGCYGRFCWIPRFTVQHPFIMLKPHGLLVQPLFSWVNSQKFIVSTSIMLLPLRLRSACHSTWLNHQKSAPLVVRWLCCTWQARAIERFFDSLHHERRKRAQQWVKVESKKNANHENDSHLKMIWMMIAP